MSRSYLEYAKLFPLDHSISGRWKVVHSKQSVLKKEIESIYELPWSEIFPEIFSSEVEFIISGTESILEKHFEVTPLNISQRIDALINLMGFGTNFIEEDSLLQLEAYIYENKMFPQLFSLIAWLCESDMKYMIKHIDPFFNDLPESYHERTLTLQVEAFKTDL